MNVEADNAEEFATGEIPGAEPFRVGPWWVRQLDSVESTNDIARGLPAWQAVVAAHQTSGRGTRGRSFSSGEGGLWMSAVVPAEDGPKALLGFPLVVGWCLVQVLRRLGCGQVRLRWPNDLMCGKLKIGGILVEHFAETAVVGVGINVTNQPWRDDPALEGIAGRLADAMEAPPSLDTLLERVLGGLRRAHGEMLDGGLARLAPAINAAWGDSRRVEAELGERLCRGRFGGIDSQGNLLIWTGDSRLQCLAAHREDRLRELPEEGGNMFTGISS
jgi:BirA family biotin operon repressor/biotin-[acetyl-CoA-carboxylase] ligase